jgi:hypothetical protein
METNSTQCSRAHHTQPPSRGPETAPIDVAAVDHSQTIRRELDKVVKILVSACAWRGQGAEVDEDFPDVLLKQMGGLITAWENLEQAIDEMGDRQESSAKEHDSKPALRPDTFMLVFGDMSQRLVEDLSVAAAAAEHALDTPGLPGMLRSLHQWAKVVRGLYLSKVEDVAREQNGAAKAQGTEDDSLSADDADAPSAVEAGPHYSADFIKTTAQSLVDDLLGVEQDLGIAETAAEAAEDEALACMLGRVRDRVRAIRAPLVAKDGAA